MKAGASVRFLNCIILVFLMINMLGCTIPDSINGANYDTNYSTVRSTFDTPSGTGSLATEGDTYIGLTEPVVEETVAEAPLSSEQQQTTRDEAGLDDSSLSSVMASQTGRYYYDTMDAQYHQLYAEILTILLNHAEDVVVSTVDSDVLQYAYLCVIFDHPEIYWIDGYNYTRHTRGGQIIYITFSGKYLYSQSQCQQFQYDIASYLSMFLGGISDTASEYQKVKYTYDYVVNHTDYDLNSRDNQNILSVFLYGESVCQGYAKAMQYLLEQLGVKSTIVIGRTNTGEGHAWNLVNIDNAYYYLDATWGDASYTAGGEAYSSELTLPVNYGYLNITTEEIERTHYIDCVVPMPRCVSMDANYYVMEGLYFTDYDYQRLYAIFDDAYLAGKEYVMFKCSSKEVYDTMYDELLNDQEIFTLLRGDYSQVTFTKSDSNYTFCFWL